MKNSRRIGALVATATAAVGMAAVTAMAPASAAPVRGPQPVSHWLGAVRGNTDSWVKIYWRTERPVCDVQVRVSGRNVDVDYRGHRRFATLTRGSTLRPGRPDFTPVEVNPDFDRAGVARLRATISYDQCGRRDRTQFKSFSLALPVLRHTGRPSNDRPGNDRPGNDRPGNSDRPGNDRPGNSDRPGSNDRQTATPSPSNSSRPSNGRPRGNRSTGPSASPSASPSVTPTS